MANSHVILVAVEMTGEGLNRKDAEMLLMSRMPRPGDKHVVRIGGYDSDTQWGTVECWWIAEDDRTDGSDNDSAVFVTPGYQKAAYDLLHDRELTPDCNDPSRDGRVLDSMWGPPEGAKAGIYVTEVPGNHPAFEVAMSNLPDVRLPHPDVPCAWCGEFVMDENACPNAKDICNDCCGED